MFLELFSDVRNFVQVHDWSFLIFTLCTNVWNSTKCYWKSICTKSISDTMLYYDRVLYSIYLINNTNIYLQKMVLSKLTMVSIPTEWMYGLAYLACQIYSIFPGVLLKKKRFIMKRRNRRHTYRALIPYSDFEFLRRFEIKRYKVLYFCHSKKM